MNTDLRPLSIGELLDRSFVLYRRNFIIFVGIAGLPALFYMASRLAWFTLLTKGQPIAVTDSALSMWSEIYGRFAILNIGLSILSFVVAITAWCALVYAASAVYLGQSTSIAQAFTALKGSLGRALGVSFVTGLLTILGFVLLIVPGILLMLRWSLVIPATMLEATGVSESRSRSSFLTEGSRGRILLIFIMWGIVMYALSTVLELPIMGALMASMFRTRAAAPVLPFWYFAATLAVSFVVTVLTSPILGIALTLQYYDGRIRKEALDLQMLMQSASTAAGA